MIEKRFVKYDKIFRDIFKELEKDDMTEDELTLYQAYISAHINLNLYILVKAKETTYDAENYILYYDPKDDIECIDYTIMYPVMEKMVDSLYFKTRKEKINEMYSLLFRLGLINIYEEVEERTEDEMISKLTRLFIDSYR